MKKTNLRISLTKVLAAFLMSCSTISCVSCNNEGDKIKDEGYENNDYDIPTSKMNVRDPFIYTDYKKQCYYFICPKWENSIASILAYESKDLKLWKSLGTIFKAPSNYLGTKDCWAPDIYEWNGAHYIFVTFTGENIPRGTTVLKSTTGPVGQYSTVLPNDKLNLTPKDMWALDGMLYVDKQNQPWMVYSGEWVQFKDGRIYAQKMKSDFTAMVGEPVYLFQASDASWTTNTDYSEGKPVFVTDAPFIWKDEESGNLILIWSSFSTQRGSLKYSIGQAISKSGSIEGPWEHDHDALNSDDGGHAMIFRDLNNKLKISYHSPNTPTDSNPTTMTIRDIKIKNGKIERIN